MVINESVEDGCRILCWMMSERKQSYMYLLILLVAILRIDGLSVRSPSQDIVYDAAIIGSGIAGLSAAAVLAAGGKKVCVLEAHPNALGGAAHEFEKKGFHFENGPSLYAGLSPIRSANPLKHVMQICGEEPEWIRYDRWGTAFENKTKFAAAVGSDDFLQRILPEYGETPDAVHQWQRLMRTIEPLGAAIFDLPPAAVREDLGATLTLGLRYGAAFGNVLVKGGPALSRPFSELLDSLSITDRFIRNWLDMLCFLLQGATCDQAPTSLMAFMLSDFYRKDVFLDYPKGGSKAIVDALVRGIEKTHHINAVATNARVQSLLVNNNRAAGVTLNDGRSIKAKHVISNADLWSTLSIVEKSKGCDQVAAYLKEQTDRLEPCSSFLHLHLGIDATGLPKQPSEQFPAQWAHLEDWNLGVDAPRNLALVSVASMLDPDLAPSGKHVIHAYVPATEPFEPWAKDFLNDDDHTNKYNSEEYKNAKTEAVQILWRAIESYIPDVRQRVELEYSASPLTHRRWLNKHKGTYGAFLPASTGEQLMAHKTCLEGFWLCGDSTFPGIGMPAVAASGTITANSILSPLEHWRLLDAIKLP